MGTWRSGWAAHEPHSRKHCSSFPQHDYLDTQSTPIAHISVDVCLAGAALPKQLLGGRPGPRARRHCAKTGVGVRLGERPYYSCLLPSSTITSPLRHTAQTGMSPAASVAMKHKGTAHRCRRTGRTGWPGSCGPSPRLQPWPCRAPRATHSVRWAGHVIGGEVKGRNRSGLPRLASGNASHHTKHARGCPKPNGISPAHALTGDLRSSCKAAAGVAWRRE